MSKSITKYKVFGLDIPNIPWEENSDNNSIIKALSRCKTECYNTKNILFINVSFYKMRQYHSYHNLEV